MRKQPNGVFFPKYSISMFLLLKKKKSKKQKTQSWCRAKHSLHQAVIFWNPVCSHGSLGEPPGAPCCRRLCSRLSLGWLCCWQHLLSCFSAATWQKTVFRPSFFWNILGQGLIGTGASLGREAWWRAVVAGGCWGSIAWGTAEGLGVLPVIPGFWSNWMSRTIS